MLITKRILFDTHIRLDKQHYDKNRLDDFDCNPTESIGPFSILFQTVYKFLYTPWSI